MTHTNEEIKNKAETLKKHIRQKTGAFKYDWVIEELVRFIMLEEEPVQDEQCVCGLEYVNDECPVHFPTETGEELDVCKLCGKAKTDVDEFTDVCADCWVSAEELTDAESVEDVIEGLKHSAQSLHDDGKHYTASVLRHVAIDLIEANHE